MITHEIFTDACYTDNYSNYLNIEELRKEVYNYIEKYDLNGREATNNCGYQSNNFNYDIIQKEYPNLDQLFNTLLIDAQSIVNNDQLHLTNSWVNINKSNHFNWPHTHPGSVLSGSFYLQTVEYYGSNNDGAITFTRPQQFHEYNLNEYLRTMPMHSYSRSSLSFYPKDGDVLFFPSHLNHRVNPHKSDIDRISIAFNTEIGA